MLAMPILWMILEWLDRCAIDRDFKSQYIIVRYSIPEEMATDYFVGNIVQDLGLEVKRLKLGRARIFTEDSRENIGLHTLTLRISDVNDNAPLFEKKSYTAYLMENNSPGVSVFSLTASDKDTGNNARISYLIDDSHKNGLSVSSYVSVSSESGVIHAVRAFDFEQIKQFQFCIKAQDGGSPPLSSNVTLTVYIKDQNDNAPQVLYPVQTGGSLVAEMVPRSADVGYLVTKVVAVDVDSGQNAWLSYKLQKATDRALFEVGLQNGEIRTIRQVTDKDAVKQKLTVVVEDNGQPSRSATVNVNVVVADSFPEVLSEYPDFAQDKDYNDKLTFYLILALAVVSLLFIFSIIAIISVKIYRWKQNKLFYQSAANLPVIPYYPPVYPDGTLGTLQRVYNYEVCGTTDSRMSDVKFTRPDSQNSLVDVSRMGTIEREKEGADVADATGMHIFLMNMNNSLMTNNQSPMTMVKKPNIHESICSSKHGTSGLFPRSELYKRTLHISSYLSMNHDKETYQLVS
uniref:Cadherin domain-containing protein n=1 Tax=Esox lucius TaxID=8010 RepID=A0AAY5L153_ESOLU